MYRVLSVKANVPTGKIELLDIGNVGLGMLRFCFIHAHDLKSSLLNVIFLNSLNFKSMKEYIAISIGWILFTPINDPLCGRLWYKIQKL